MTKLKIKSYDFNYYFNIIFNKIPYIYGEIFLKIFSIPYYNLSLDYGSNIFINILSNSLNNYKTFFKRPNLYTNLNKDITSYLPTLNNQTKESIINYLTDILSTNIEEDFLISLTNNTLNNKEFFLYNHISSISKKDLIIIYQISESYLISKVLIKIIDILNNYNNLSLSIKRKLNKDIESIRTYELIMDNVYDIYKEEYKNFINKPKFKILVYLLCISRNAKEIEKSYSYNLDQIINKIGIDNQKYKIIAYQRGYDYLDITLNQNKTKSNLFNYNYHPYINKTIKLLIQELFDLYHDDYNFLKNKDKILKICFYNYIKKIDLKDKISICTTYKLWSFEWDSIKEKYE